MRFMGKYARQPGSNLRVRGDGIVSVFTCEMCRGSAFVIGGELTDATLVRCDDCGVPLGSWAEFRENLERSLSDSAEPAGSTPDRSSRRKRTSARHA